MNVTPNSTHWIPPSQGLGYQFEHADHAAETALLKALDYLRTSRWAGAEMRDWSKKIQNDIREKIQLTKHQQSGSSLTQQLNDINDWEMSLRKSIQSYMDKSTEILKNVKLLNPPLSTEHIKPFTDALEQDRLQTITALRPLTQILDELSALRDQLRQGRFPPMIFNPTV